MCWFLSLCRLAALPCVGYSVGSAPRLNHREALEEAAHVCQGAMSAMGQKKKKTQSNIVLNWQHSVHVFKSSQSRTLADPTLWINWSGLWAAPITSPQIDVFFPFKAKWCLGAVLQFVPDVKVVESERGIHQIWPYLPSPERSRDVIDTQSLFENDGALFHLYFQPPLSPPRGRSRQIMTDSRPLCSAQLVCSLHLLLAWMCNCVCWLGQKEKDLREKNRDS